MKKGRGGFPKPSDQNVSAKKSCTIIGAPEKKRGNGGKVIEEREITVGFWRILRLRRKEKSTEREKLRESDEK